ncbi:MAG TPA: hypothetical protein PK177_11985 [Burkholderiaceae bacterium]|nr:hypothetical protein [Burkholderiaceae bacterium]
MKKSLHTFALLAALPLASLAESADPSHGTFQVCANTDAPVSLAFANGLLSTWVSANEALDATVSKLEQEKKGLADRGTLLFHADKGLLDELRAVFEQRLAEVELSADDKQAAYASFFAFLAASENEPLAGADWWAQTRQAMGAVVLARMTAFAARDAAELRSDAANDVAAIEGLLDAGKGVLVVAHGHGNLYANAALKQAVNPGNEARVRYLGAATAAATHWPGTGGLTYASSAGDDVLNALRIALILASHPEPLPANQLAPHPVLAGSFTGHGYVANYLSQATPAGASFRGMLSNAFTSVKSAPASPGALAFRLTQTAQLDAMAATSYNVAWTVQEPQEFRTPDETVVASVVETFDPGTSKLTVVAQSNCGYMPALASGLRPLLMQTPVEGLPPAPSSIMVTLQPGNAEPAVSWVPVDLWPHPGSSGRWAMYTGMIGTTPSHEGITLFWSASGPT